MEALSISRPRQNSHRAGWIALVLLMLACAGRAQSVRVIKFSDAKPFHMGAVTSMRIVHPDVGAKHVTLNYSESVAGAEFAQHVHDYSDDNILILQGQADLRQGDSRKPFHEGQFAFVPAGQIHGTVTTGTGKTIMISFQVPPDLVLYTGARDSSKPGAAPPKGIITPGAVKFGEFADRSGFFISPRMGAMRGAATYRKLKAGESFSASAGSGGELMLFVWKGAIQVKDKSSSYSAGEKDTVFAFGPADLKVRSNAPETVVIEVQAPPKAGW